MTQKRYESTYILNPNLSEADSKTHIAKFEETVTKNGGKVINSELWGMRKLAYPIKKLTNGQYVSIHFTAPGSVIAKLERAYQLDENVLRWLTLEMPDKNHESRIAMRKRVEEVEARRQSMMKAQAEGTAVGIE
jgi:small subunit ribosomal protein S6